MGIRRLGALGVLAVLALELGVTRARAAEVGYSAIDLATVRIFALEGVGTLDVRHKETDRPYTLAVPLAGHGSGLLVSADGLILTARHVVEGARQIVVLVPGENTPLLARVVYVDDRQDFAFVSVGGTHTTFATLPTKSPTLRVRQGVFAVGYPLDPGKKRPQSTPGVISGTGTEDAGTYTLGISVNPGNSGGALVDEKEQVLGVVVARGDPQKGIQGIGIAVSLDRPLAVLPKVLERHARAHGILDSLPDAERASARVIGSLVEGEGIFKMLSEAEHALTHLKKSALSREMKTALASPDADPDLLVLGCAYHWNAAVVHRVLGEAGWQKELKIAEGYCSRATQGDTDVAVRSPVVKLVTPDSSYRLVNSQAPSSSPKPPSATAPAGAAGFSFGSAVTDVARICKDAKFSLTGVKKEGLRCSGAPVSVGFPAVVRLRFCEDELCRIDVIQKFEGDDPSLWLTAHEQRRKTLEAAYGPPGRTVHRLSPDCTESIAWCLSNRKAQLEDTWAWLPDKTSIYFRMDRIDSRGVLKMTFERR